MIVTSSGFAWLSVALASSRLNKRVVFMEGNGLEFAEKKDRAIAAAQFAQQAQNFEIPVSYTHLLARRFPVGQQEAILKSSLDLEGLGTLPVNDYLGQYVA